jgi:predicted glycoside hydrolase/deacetylase ChbG (UPF0249 family)
MRSTILWFIVAILGPFAAHADQAHVDSAQTTVLIRCDDLGMCHSVNKAAKQVFETGIPVSVSVMFVCPWYQEAVELLKRYPNVSVGVHLTLNAEWKNYRWGPIVGRTDAASLVDSLGYFFPSRAAFFANGPKLEEIRNELKAQIDRAIHSGLHIDYLDHHMSTAVDKPELRAVVESLAREYGLPISRYFGETDISGVYNAPLANKLDTLLARTKSLKAGVINLMVFHIGLQTAEMDALEDMNSFGLREMSKHREAELKALTSPQFLALVRLNHIRLTTYREVLKEAGLSSMKRPTPKD